MMPDTKNFGLNGTLVWPTQIFFRHWEQHHQRSKGIVAFLREMKSKQSTLIESGIAVGAKSSKGLYEGNFDLFAVEENVLQELVAFIKRTLALAVSIANNQEARPEEIAIEFPDSWYHITNDGGYHDAHFHQGCSWCGIYYLQIGSSGQRSGSSAPNGGSRFYSPIHIGGAHQDYGNKYLTPSIDPPIEDGLLLLFPSYLLHCGLPYLGEEDRIVIAFNARAYLRS